MAVQIRTLESEIAQEKIEVDHLQELLRQAHHKHEKDKEALKKATRYDSCNKHAVSLAKASMIAAIAI